MIKKVVEHIWKYYTKRLYVSDLAKIANMNEQYFCRFFKKYLGKTPMAYINTYRLQQAALLLETTDIPITTLCLECGFTEFFRFRTGTIDSSACRKSLSAFEESSSEFAKGSANRRCPKCITQKQ